MTTCQVMPHHLYGTMQLPQDKIGEFHMWDFFLLKFVTTFLCNECYVLDILEILLY
jgi:hypothetical protein